MNRLDSMVEATNAAPMTAPRDDDGDVLLIGRAVYE